MAITPTLPTKKTMRLVEDLEEAGVEVTPEMRALIHILFEMREDHPEVFQTH